MRLGRDILVGLACIVACCGLACTTLQASAAQDPQRCERDPKCARHQDKSKDCVTMCVDDPACIERCQEVNGQRW